MNIERRPLIAAPRFTPLWGVLIGAVGGGVYWMGAQLWPTSIAVILSMLATALIAARLQHGAPEPGGGASADRTTHAPAPASAHELLGSVFALLIKYNALMALSAASLPFVLPSNVALGFIMIAGRAASRALLVSITASPARLAHTPSPSPSPLPPSHADLGIALAVGFAPAALIGIPGLIGLVAAIAARFVVIAYLRPRASVAGRLLEMIREVTEVCFYLGALAAWAYI